MIGAAASMHSMWSTHPEKKIEYVICMFRIGNCLVLQWWEQNCFAKFYAKHVGGKTKWKVLF